MKKLLAVLGILIVLAAPVLAGEEKLDKAKYMKYSQDELKRLHKINFDKGVELYKLKQYKLSIPYSNKAIFFSNILIKQAKLRQRAINLLKEARKWVGEAKKEIK